ncbi:MAG TPA: hypothetical protein VHU22_05160 [Xanthobacteraceae bacterium]|nr:hypothetical protein [Xanthobacteraceae bacterium]
MAAAEHNSRGRSATAYALPYGDSLTAGFGRKVGKLVKSKSFTIPVNAEVKVDTDALRSTIPSLLYPTKWKFNDAATW